MTRNLTSLLSGRGWKGGSTPSIAIIIMGHGARLNIKYLRLDGHGRKLQCSRCVVCERVVHKSNKSMKCSNCSAKEYTLNANKQSIFKMKTRPLIMEIKTHRQLRKEGNLCPCCKVNKKWYRARRCYNCYVKGKNENTKKMPSMPNVK